MSYPIDTQYEQHVLSSVTGEPGKGWELAFADGWCFWCPADSPVEPKVGDIVRLYGKGIGYAVRGLYINGHRVFYRTEAEEAAKRATEAVEREVQKRKDFEQNRAAMDAKYDALPEPFRRRIDRFRAANPNFRWDFESYEVFCCEQAVAIADALKTPDAIHEFHGLDWSEQLRRVPGLSDGHSGNTFGAACRLAQWYVTQPENVVREHGALAVLVGCKEYGCTHPTPPKDTPDDTAR